ncbi:aspartate--ammonia ligase [Trichonephila inaurata madagascariensis]|uniref:Aspartate--ammonia ligase n=1 Tax=Trichonephila inaurata madagascariensis TaxID=2747483 RepID=A0A8X6JJ22_9ARAC|nr:aspartate--ammonia ligase [Trichonephila inaurata madagascariensis]
MAYSSKLSLLETQKAIKMVKVKFEDELCQRLNLTCVSPPLFVETNSGLNDDLNGCEKPVTFELKSGITASVVHSLAKWKRMALRKYGFPMYNGLYTNMNAIRKDEDVGPLHSYYVDQWDWEKVIQEEDRNIPYLRSVVKSIYECLLETERYITEKFPVLRKKLPSQIVFISAQEMEDEYPQLPPKEREKQYTKKFGAVFVSQVGKTLKSGEKHDGRAPDYDDWDLNGDILVHHDELDVSFELSSMGIRVSKDSLISQLTERDAMYRLDMSFHQALLRGELPFTIGGGIGQSRLCMFLLDKIHVGEVQASVWDMKTKQDCANRNIVLL